MESSPGESMDSFTQIGISDEVDIYINAVYEFHNKTHNIIWLIS